jgi:hypothetical protein
MWQNSTGHRGKTRQTTKMDRFSLSRSSLTLVFLALSILCNSHSVYASHEKNIEEISSLPQEKLLVKANEAPSPTNLQGNFFPNFFQCIHVYTVQAKNVTWKSLILIDG